MVTFTEEILNGKLHFFCAVVDLMRFVHELVSGLSQQLNRISSVNKKIVLMI